MFTSHRSQCGSWKSKIKMLADSVSREGPFFQKMVFSLCPHMAEGVRELSQVSYKGTNLTLEGSTLMN
jgi:hypothetical protein